VRQRGHLGLAAGGARAAPRALGGAGRGVPPAAQPQPAGGSLLRRGRRQPRVRGAVAKMMACAGGRTATARPFQLLAASDAVQEGKPKYCTTAVWAIRARGLCVHTMVHTSLSIIQTNNCVFYSHARLDNFRLRWEWRRARMQEQMITPGLHEPIPMISTGPVKRAAAAAWRRMVRRSPLHWVRLRGAAGGTAGGGGVAAGGGGCTPRRGRVRNLLRTSRFEYSNSAASSTTTSIQTGFSILRQRFID
jgi:hypothetical protein